MALPGECVTTGAPLPFEGAMPQICQSPAGFYVGYTDREGMPYSRESGYYRTSQDLKDAWILGVVDWRGDRGIRYPAYL